MLGSIVAVVALHASLAAAVGGGSSGRTAFTYTSKTSGSVSGGSSSVTLKSSNFEYTGFGAAESTIDFGPNPGDLIYSPAFTTKGIGYAKSSDSGKTWTQVLPGYNQTRAQPVLRKHNDRIFFWTSAIPGLQFTWSDDYGKTWKAHKNLEPLVQDWAKLIAGKPVRSKLASGQKDILYLSAPSLISTPIPIQPLGPLNQIIEKSLDGGVTWTKTKTQPSLQPNTDAKLGGACADPKQNLGGQELIIWSDGFVKPNGTIIFSVRRCQTLSLAISDDEGDSWRFVDVPGSKLPPFNLLIATYLVNGNVLTPKGISIDAAGNLFAIWSDLYFKLKMSVSKNGGKTWSTPVVIGAPGVSTYLPILVHNSNGNAALAYYGSSDNGTSWNGYIAESANILSSTPTWSSIIGNPASKPLQKNDNKAWDQGYFDPFWDLIEVTDLKYDSSGNLITAFTRKMCSSPSGLPQIYNSTTCEPGWNYTAHASSPWQGIVLWAKH